LDQTLWRIENYRRFLENRREVLAQTVNESMASVITDRLTSINTIRTLFETPPKELA